MGNWNENEFEYHQNLGPKTNEQWRYGKYEVENKESQTEQNDTKSLNSILNNEMNNQNYEINCSSKKRDDQLQSKQTKFRCNTSQKKQKNKSKRRQAPKLPPRGYDDDEYQPLIGVLNKEKDVDCHTNKGTGATKRPYKRMTDIEEGKKYSAPIIIKGKNKSIICPATIDCGSFTSCISKKMHEKLGKKSQSFEPIKVKSAKGDLQIKEKVWLKVNFDHIRQKCHSAS